MDTDEKVKLLEEKMLELERGFSDIKMTLREQAVDRHEYNKKLSEKVDTIQVFFKKHTEEEMDKYDKIVEALDNLAKITEGNADYINKQEIEEEVQRRLEEEAKSSVWYRIKDKVILTAVGTATVAFVAASWKIIVVLLDLYNKMNGVV